MKNFNEMSRQNYNEKADNYDNTFDGKFTMKFKQHLLEEISILSGYSILDIACGNGSLLNMLSDKYNIQGYGIDISEKMIENAKLKNPNMTFKIANCENIPFEDKMFDVITVCASFHHFPNIKNFAKEAERLLKPNGIIYIAEIYLHTAVRFFCNPFLHLSEAGDVKFYSPKEIANNFKAFGFKQIQFKKSKHIQIISMQKL